MLIRVDSLPLPMAQHTHSMLHCNKMTQTRLFAYRPSAQKT